MYKIKPSKKWIILSGLFAFLMVVLISVTGIIYQSAPKAYFDPADTTTVSIEQGGKYELYYEYEHINQLSGDLTLYFRNTQTNEILHANPQVNMLVTKPAIYPENWFVSFICRRAFTRLPVIMKRVERSLILC